MRLWTNAAERLRIDSSGNVGFGVVPSAWSGFRAFQQQNTSIATDSGNQFYLSQNWFWNGSADTYIANGFATRYRQSSGTHQWFNAPSGTAGNAITFTQAMTLTAAGDLGIGTTGPNTKLQVDNGANSSFVRTTSTQNSSGFDFGVGGSGDSTAYIYNRNNTPIVFGTNSAERARIDANGNLLVGTTSQQSTNEKMSVRQTENSDGLVVRATNASLTTVPFAVLVDRNTTNGSYVAISYYNVGAAATRFRVMDSGNVQNTNNSYGAISDLKLKQDITDATPKLAELMQVRVVNYRFKSDPTHKQIGVIAQELEQVFPGMVEESPDHDAEGNDLGTTTKAVKYSVFVPMLIKAMQEQQQMIEELKAKVAALENA
jgi:hypothetical protein